MPPVTITNSWLELWLKYLLSSFILSGTGALKPSIWLKDFAEHHSPLHPATWFCFDDYTNCHFSAPIKKTRIRLISPALVCPGSCHSCQRNSLWSRTSASRCTKAAVSGREAHHRQHCLSSEPTLNFCRCSKFLYDVIKANSKWLRPPESQLEDKRQKFAGRKWFQA